jgi:hypothetical protein
VRQEGACRDFSLLLNLVKLVLSMLNVLRNGVEMGLVTALNF